MIVLYLLLDLIVIGIISFLVSFVVDYFDIKSFLNVNQGIVCFIFSCFLGFIITTKEVPKDISFYNFLLLLFQPINFAMLILRGFVILFLFLLVGFIAYSVVAVAIEFGHAVAAARKNDTTVYEEFGKELDDNEEDEVTDSSVCEADCRRICENDLKGDDVIYLHLLKNDGVAKVVKGEYFIRKGNRWFKDKDSSVLKLINEQILHEEDDLAVKIDEDTANKLINSKTGKSN